MLTNMPVAFYRQQQQQPPASACATCRGWPRMTAIGTIRKEWLPGGGGSSSVPDLSSVEIGCAGMCAYCDTQRNVPVTIHSPAPVHSTAQPVRVACGEEFIIALQHVRVTANNICLACVECVDFNYFIYMYINGIAQHESNHYGENIWPINPQACCTGS
jgi:hypothetical protein